MGRPARTILRNGTDGVVAVHSLSKRSNLAGARAGFYAGDAELVALPQRGAQAHGAHGAGPVQAAAVAAFGDDAHVDEQRERYHRRLERMIEMLAAVGIAATMPAGWLLPVGAGARRRRLGARADSWPSRPACSCRPASSTATRARGHVRIAVVQPDAQLELVAQRLGA